MNLNRLNIVLCVLLVAVTVSVAVLRRDPSRPNFEFLPEMKRSTASHAFSASDVFANGRTMQSPVSGTLARGDLPLYFDASKSDAERAGRELRNPFADTADADFGSDKPVDADADPAADFRASVRRGAGVFNIYCICCHGPRGAGDGPVAKRGFPPPPSLTTGKSREMPDGRLFHILTWGQGSMSPMASQLSRAQRWDAINYVRSLQGAEEPDQGAAADANSKVPAEEQP